jgi:rod shape-determining protein MreD
MSASGLARAIALILVALAAIAVELAPLPGATGDWPTPDLLLCALGAAALNRPTSVPPAMAFALGLLRDLLSGAAVGAGALGLMAAIASLRSVGESLRRRGFPARWAAFLGASALAAMVPLLLLTLSLAPPPGLGEIALRLGATALVYPLFALAMRAAPRFGPADPVASGQGMFARRAI